MWDRAACILFIEMVTHVIVHLQMRFIEYIIPLDKLNWCTKREGMY